MAERYAMVHSDCVHVRQCKERDSIDEPSSSNST